MSSDKTVEVFTADLEKGVKLQVGFELTAEEKEKLQDVAKYYGLGLSACLRMLVIKTWRDKVQSGE